MRAPLTRIMSLVDLLETKNVKAERLELMKYLRISANELDEIVTLIANQTPTEFSLNRS